MPRDPLKGIIDGWLSDDDFEHIVEERRWHPSRRAELSLSFDPRDWPLFADALRSIRKRTGGFVVVGNAAVSAWAYVQQMNMLDILLRPEDLVRVLRALEKTRFRPAVHQDEPYYSELTTWKALFAKRDNLPNPVRLMTLPRHGILRKNPLRLNLWTDIGIPSDRVFRNGRRLTILGMPCRVSSFEDAMAQFRRPGPDPHAASHLERLRMVHRAMRVPPQPVSHPRMRQAYLHRRVRGRVRIVRGRKVAL